MDKRKRIGVVLFQLGGPDRLEAVEPFLYNLFCDPDILDLPLGGLARRPLAKWISMRRAKKVAQAYAEIGGGSPIRELTERQAQALERNLSAHVDARVVVAMRYWKPFTADAVRALAEYAPEEIVLLPLYPQFSFSTTGSSLKEWQRQFSDARCPVHTIRSFHDHPRLIEAFVENIHASLAQFAEPEAVQFVFSAHGLPVSFIARGDPYQQQVEETVQRVMQQGGWPNPHVLCYQSKVGRQQWLEPSLEATIARLGAAGVTSVLVIPISFVSEHIETLHELNIEARENAESVGIRNFAVMPALNDSPTFITALTELVLGALGLGDAPTGTLVRKRSVDSA
jgi:ferrochelatase